MDVNTICGNQGIAIRVVPEGVSMPESAVVTQDDIEALYELEWGLSYLQQFLELSSQMRGQLGSFGQTGGISDRAWGLWTEVSSQLVSETGVTAAALPLEQVIRGVVEKIDTEDHAEKQADLTLLSAILTSYDQFLAAFHAGFNSGNCPIASAENYDTTRSFKHNIRPMLARINSRLSQKLQTEINLAAINWTSLSAATVEQVNARVADSLEDSCNDHSAAIPEPPKPEVRLFEYGINLTPSHAVQLTGDTTAPVSSGPLLQGEAVFGHHINEELMLQLTYQAMLGVNSFSDWTSDMSYDTGIVSFRYNDLTAQASYIYQRDFMNDGTYHLGSLAAGYSLLNGYLEPFGGGIVGGNDKSIGGGGLVGVRSAQQYQVGESDLSRIGYSLQALGTLIYADELNVRPGGTAAFTWRPVSFGGADLEVSAQVSGLYHTEPSGANIVPGVTIGWNTQNLIAPYPAFLY